MNRLRSNKGDTIIEVLAALVIVMLSVVMLLTSIAKANELTKKIEKDNYSFNRSKEKSINTNISVRYGDKTNTKEIVLYEDNGYYFYEK